jgi:uncharacterized protein (DUF2141 family)
MKHSPLAVLLATLAAGPVFAQDQTPGAHFIQNWDADGDGAVSVEEATTRRGDIFTAFDADEDGFLSDEEYALFDEARANDRAAMQEGMGQGMGQGNGQGNGQGQGQGNGQGQGMGQGMGQGNGMGPGMGMGMGAEEGMMRAFNDVDGDGRVSRDEFMARVPDWYAMMDRNADGTITTDDFGPGN